jgi:hypothetical protein
MNSIKLEQHISEFCLTCQVLESVEADFEKKTWTFSGETMLVSAGDYLIVPKREFDRFVAMLRGE